MKLKGIFILSVILVFTSCQNSNTNSGKTYEKKIDHYPICKNYANQMAEIETELIIQMGHTDIVNSVEFSPDGKLLLTASTDKTAKLWEPKTGKLILNIEGSVSGLSSAIWSIDGSEIITFGTNGNIKVYSRKSGKLLRNLIGHKGYIVQTLLSEDGLFLFTSSIDTTAKIWNIQSGEILFNYVGNQNNGFTAESKWSPDGTKLAVVSKNGFVNILSIDDKYASIVLDDYANWPELMIWSRDGNMLTLTNPVYKSATLWNTSTGDLIQFLEGDIGWYNTVKWSPAGTELLLSSWNDSVGRVARTWNARTGKLKYTLDANDTEVLVSNWSPNGNNIASAISDNSLKIWDTRNGQLLHTLYGHNKNINSVTWSRNGEYIVTTSYDKSILVWDVNKEIVLKKLSGHSIPVTSASWNKEEHKILAIYDDNTTKVWDALQGRLIYSLKNKSGQVSSASWSPNFSMVLTSSTSGAVNIWDTETGSLLKYIETNDKGVRANFGISGEKIITTSTDSCVKIWDLSTGTLLNVISEQKYHTRSISLLPDGLKLITVIEDGIENRDYTSKIWNIETGKLLNTFSGVASWGESKTWSSDGVNIFVGLEQRYGQIYNSETGEIITQLDGSDGWIENVAWSPNDSLIAICSYDKDIEIWNSKSGKLERTLSGCAGWIKSIKWFPNSTNLLVLPFNEPIQKWNISKNKLLSSINIGSFIAEQVTFDDNLIISILNSQIKVSDLSTGKEIAQFIAIDSTDYFVKTPDNYYLASKDGLKWLSFKVENKLYSFEQFDLKYNRPDIVLERLGSTDTTLIELYHRAYLKRLKKMGFKEEDLGDDFHVPESQIQDFEYMPAINQEEIDLNLNFKDSEYKLDRYNIWINEVPLYGINGKSLKHLKTDSIAITETITLSQGENKIQVSCLNEKASESYKESVEITYEPNEVSKPNLYLVCMGVSDYADNEYDLTFADKDGRDLVDFYTSNASMYNNIYLDTLFNSDVSLNNIRNIKPHLLKSKVDDHVLVLISGHGILDDSLDFYFATYDMNFDNPKENGVLYDEFVDLLDNIPSRNKMLLIDACHSGEIDKDQVTDLLASSIEVSEDPQFINVPRGDAERQIKINELSDIMNTLFVDIRSGNGATVITAAKGDEYAEESSQLENGVFTYAIINGLKNNAADEDNENGVTVSELRSFVIEQVEILTNGRQKPTSRQENIEFDYRMW